MHDASKTDREKRIHGKLFANPKSRAFPIILRLLVTLVAFVAFMSVFLGETQGAS